MFVFFYTGRRGVGERGMEVSKHGALSPQKPEGLLWTG